MCCWADKEKKECERQSQFYVQCFYKTDANISSLLVVPEYLWPCAHFAHEKTLEIKTSGFSQWSPAKDSKATTAGKGYKEKQSAVRCW